MNKTKIILCFFVALLFLCPAPVWGIEYSGIGGRPAFPRPDNSRSKSIFIHEISPEQIIEEGVNVVNNTQEAKTLLIYATDETPSTNGGFACKQFSEPVNGVGSWIQVEKDEITLESIASETIPFTITIPEVVDVGEHNGCIIIQEKKEKTDEAGLKLSFRTGIRVALTVPGEIIKSLKIIDFQIKDKDLNTYVLSPSIENTGNVSIDANIKVIVSNVFSKKTLEFGGNYAVLRNNPLVLNFDFIKPFWGGKYVAETIVTYNNGEGEIRLVSDKLKFFSMPHKQALIYIGSGLLIVFLILGFWICLLVKKRKRRKDWYDYVATRNEPLAEIIKRHKASWKEVVKVNKLKPPYEIKEGQVIKLPPLKT